MTTAAARRAEPVRAWRADPYSDALRAGQGPLYLRRADGWLLPLDVTMAAIARSQWPGAVQRQHRRVGGAAGAQQRREGDGRRRPIVVAVRASCSRAVKVTGGAGGNVGRISP